MGEEGVIWGCWRAIFPLSFFCLPSHSLGLFSLAWERGHSEEDGDGMQGENSSLPEQRVKCTRDGWMDGLLLVSAALAVPGGGTGVASATARVGSTKGREKINYLLRKVGKHPPFTSGIQPGLLMRLLAGKWAKLL